MKKEMKFALHTIAAVLFTDMILSGAYAKDKKVKKTGTVKTVIVGTGNAFKPYCYLDDNGNLTGYEKDVLEAVDALLPQYTFEYEQFAFKDILISLGVGKIDMGAHQFETNPERRKNFLFSDETYTSFILYIVVPEGNTSIHGIDDLKGKTVQINVGDNAAYTLEQYNKSHPDGKINLAYLASPPREQIAAGIKNGTWDAFIDIKRDVDIYNREYNAGFKTVGKPIATSFTYYIFAKSNTELQQAVDGALRQLKKSGKLSAISVKDLGADYTQGE